MKRVMSLAPANAREAALPREERVDEDQDAQLGDEIAARIAEDMRRRNDEDAERARGARDTDGDEAERGNRKGRTAQRLREIYGGIRDGTWAEEVGGKRARHMYSGMCEAMQEAKAYVFRLADVGMPADPLSKLELGVRVPDESHTFWTTGGGPGGGCAPENA